MDYTSIGRNIRKHRLAQGLRQEETAERVGLSTNYYGSIERGEKIPALETFIAIINGLDMSADYALSDVLKVGYTAKNSALDERMKNLPEDERGRIYEVLEVMLQHAERRNQA